MVKQRLEYQGQLRVQAKHEPSGQTVFTDAPLDNHGQGQSFSPTDLLCTSLASCMMTIMGIQAQQLKINLEGMCCDLEKHMSSDLPRRVVQIDLTIQVPLSLSDQHKSTLEKAALTCPVKYSIHPDIALNLDFQWG